MAGHTDADKIKGALALIGPTAFASSDDYQAFRAIFADAPDATDAAQARADELGVDIASVQGTGADGKVTVADVEAAAK